MRALIFTLDILCMIIAFAFRCSCWRLIDVFDTLMPEGVMPLIRRDAAMPCYATVAAALFAFRLRLCRHAVYAMAAAA